MNYIERQQFHHRNLLEAVKQANLFQEETGFPRTNPIFQWILADAHSNVIANFDDFLELIALWSGAFHLITDEDKYIILRFMQMELSNRVPLSVFDWKHNEIHVFRGETEKRFRKIGQEIAFDMRSWSFEPNIAYQFSKTKHRKVHLVYHLQIVPNTAHFMSIQHSKVSFANEDEVIVAGFRGKITSVELLSMSTFELSEEGRMVGQPRKVKVKVANLAILIV
jgi:hypothetical protein